ncbi:MAG: thiamine-phosphate kinase [Nocardioidaceae bacterium]|nr:thiamine-phosphate kinase [Nocardioidaceae bacterium]
MGRMTTPDPAFDPVAGLAPEATLADVGEFGLVGRLAGIFEQGEHVVVGPGDDAALVRTKGGHVVVSTDLLVEDRHFRRTWASAEQIGRKAAAEAISDVNAMGGRTHTLTVGLAVPPDLPARWAIDLARGIAAEAARAGASVVGGDLTRADQVVIALTVLGSCEVAPVLRSGAGVRDVVAMAGRQGWAAGGLAILTRGFRSPRALVEAYQVPEPPYDAGPAAALAGATSMIDVSDGLLADLDHIAQASGLRIDIDTAAFDLAEPLRAVGAALSVDPLQFVLGGGDDHPLVATFPPDVELPEGWIVIGRCRSGEPQVTVDGEEYDGPRGWDHFAR